MINSSVYPFALLVFLLSAGLTTASPIVPEGTGGAINLVVGDASFIERFGRVPTLGDGDSLRIATHLAWVEARLRAREISQLSISQRAERRRALDRLRAYRLAGHFPSNRRPWRSPSFMDDDGRICAVGYLLAASEGLAAAERIDAGHRFDYIDQIDEPALDAWLLRSGLTREEAAMIQPAYVTAWPALYVTGGVSAGVTAHAPFTPSLLGSVPASLESSMYGFGYGGGIGMELMLIDRRPSSISILGHVSYENRSASLESPGPGVLAEDGRGGRLAAPTIYTADLDWHAVTVDGMAAFTLQHRLGVMAGLAYSHAFDARRNERVRIDVDDPAVTYVDTAPYPVDASGRVATAYDADLPDAARSSLAIRGGLRLQFLPRSRGLVTSATVVGTVPISEIGSHQPWRLWSLQVGAEVMLPIAYSYVEEW